jgi:twitching motility two-component system response regulator PilG
MTLDNSKNTAHKGIKSAAKDNYDIFVVDDNFDQANIMKLLIEQSGFSANFTTDSEAAYQTIIKDKPRLVILDLMMPELDGLKLLKMIKENPDTRSVKIIIYSGKLYDSDRRKAFTLGADIFLTKPTRSQVLMDSIRSLLDSNRNEIFQN